MLTTKEYVYELNYTMAEAQDKMCNILINMIGVTCVNNMYKHVKKERKGRHNRALTDHYVDQ